MTSLPEIIKQLRERLDFGYYHAPEDIAERILDALELCMCQRDWWISEYSENYPDDDASEIVERENAKLAEKLEGKCIE
jgi:hypothetical protein